MNTIDINPLLINLTIAFGATLFSANSLALRRLSAVIGVFAIMAVSTSVGDLLALVFVDIIKLNWFWIIRTVSSILMVILSHIILRNARK